MTKETVKPVTTNEEVAKPKVSNTKVKQNNSEVNKSTNVTKFTKEEFIQTASVFDYTPEMVAGALYNVDKDLSKVEFINIMKDFTKNIK